MARSKKDDAVVDTVDETPAIEAQSEPKVEIVAEAPAISDVKTAEEGVAELKERLKSSEEAQKRLERERNEAVNRAYQANAEKDESDLITFRTSLNYVTEQNKVLKREYAQALANQDYDRAADIQEAISTNQAAALQFRNGEAGIKEKPKAPPPPLDPVEAFIANANLGPKPAAWIRAHPEYATNGRLTDKMIAADRIAADDYERGSDDYFAAVEGLLKINRRSSPAIEEEQFSDASRPTSGRQTAPAAIPVSREVTTSGQRQRTIRLTADQADAAERSQMTHAEWWREYQKIEAEKRGYAN